MLVVGTSLLFVLGLLAPAVGAQQPGNQEAAEHPMADVPDTEVRPGVRDSVVRLYGAVFDRAPDDAGLRYWVERYVGGMTLTHMAQAFMAADEWVVTYGAVDDPGFVELLYGNVLGRGPDPEGGAYWLGRLAGGLGRSAMLVGFSESPEYVVRTGTAPPEAPPVIEPPLPAFPALPAGSGAGRRVVYSGTQQRVWWVDERERVVQSYLVSGRRNTPAPGTYQVFSKSPVAWAGHDGITMRHMVRFTRGRNLAIGFHSIPRYGDGRPMQTEAQLGTYRSSGCVRQADSMAEALYAWADIGTTVVVTH